MPNFCQCKLIISHPDIDVVDRLQQSIIDGRLLRFIKPLPAPETCTMSTEEHKWRVGNWGTKWDICYQHSLQRDDLQISVEFETAWSPPIEALREAVKLGCSVHIYYYEPGCGFAGDFKEDPHWGPFDSSYDINCNETGTDSLKELLGDELYALFGLNEKYVCEDDETDVNQP